MKLKVGDKIVSRIDIYDYRTRFTSKFICGPNITFEVIDIGDDHVMLKYDNCELFLPIPDVVFGFYTNNELRKLKLEKLK